MKLTQLAAVTVTSLLALACVSNPINAQTGSKYYEAGFEAEARGNYSLARENFNRASTNARTGNLGPTAEAYSTYEWARMSGYMGLFTQAEQGFGDVLELIDDANGKADDLRVPCLLELARLLHDTGHHGRAVPFYEQAVVELEQLQIEDIDPIGYALILDDYAKSLGRVGLHDEAGEVIAQATSIKSANPGVVADFVGKRYVTP